MSISSIGIGSGVLTSELIDKLAEAERAPTELRLDRKQAEVDAKLSAVGRIRNALTDLRLPSRVLSNPDALKALEANSTSSNVGVTADSGAATGQYSVEVTELAQTQSLSTGTFDDKDATAMGTGTMSFKVGDKTTNITIDGTNNTLEGIANAVNAEEGLNVNASVIDTGAGFVLVFSAQESGTDNAIDITVTDTGDGVNDDNSGLSQFAFNETTTNLAETVEAKDAAFSVNGIDITRSSNTITDVVDGLSFTLTGKTEGSPATIAVTMDADKVLERVQEFVDKFNDVKTALNELTEFNSSNAAESGILLGDSTVRTINTQMRQIIGQVVPGLESSSVRSLSEIGISSNRTDGTLSIDETAFKKQLAENPDDLVALFADQGRTSDAQVSFESKNIDTVAGSYDVNITQAATQGSFTGAQVLAATVDINDGNNTFKIKVDGTESSAITLANNAAYTQEQLVSALQAQIDADSNLSSAGKFVTVSIDDSGQLQFDSKTYGSASSVEFTEVGATMFDDLGIGVAAGTVGLDVAGTINGQEATGSGQQLTAATGDDSEGLKINVEGTATGDRGKVTYIEGVAEQMVDKLNSFLEFNGIIGAKETGLNDRLTEIATERVQLDQRVETLRSRLALQFTSADILIGQLNSTKDFLESQLSALTGNNKD